MTTQKASEFEAAKTVTEALQGLDMAQQERALRWASEALGLQSAPNRAPAHQSPPTPGEAPAGNLAGNPTGGSTPAIDIRRFVRSKSPNSHMQLAAAVAYFYKFIAPPQDRKESISAEDLSDAIRQIGGWSQPKRPKMTLNNAKNQGYLDTAGGGSFKLNSVGENLVTMTLGADGTNETPKRKTPKKKAKVTARKKKSAK